MTHPNDRVTTKEAADRWDTEQQELMQKAIEKQRLAEARAEEQHLQAYVQELQVERRRNPQVYDYRAFIVAYASTLAYKDVDRELSRYHQQLYKELSVFFGVRLEDITPNARNRWQERFRPRAAARTGSDMFDAAVFGAAVRRYASLHLSLTDAAGILEGYSSRAMPHLKVIQTAEAETRRALLDLMASIYVGLYGDPGRSITSDELRARGFDDSEVPFSFA